MIHGPDIEDLKEHAKTMVMTFFVEQAERDGTPATLRALYVMKVAEAKTVLAGGASELIEGEAALVGSTPEQLANVIVEMARQSTELELARMRVNTAIKTAADEGEVVKILEGLGIQFSMELPVEQLQV